MKVKDIALDGVVRQNPVFRLVLGTCPTLAITTAMSNVLGMGLAVIFVLIFSNMLVSLLRNIIPDKVRIPAYVLIIATFVTIVTMVVEKFLPDLFDALGVYLPLIVVNCIILARAESFASSNSVGKSIYDGLFMGLGYMLAGLLIAFIREFLGAGMLFGVVIMEFRIEFFAQPAGAFFTYGILIALFNHIYNRVEKKSKETQKLRAHLEYKEATETEVNL